jgi:phosphoribosylpyrophosphate synthetase
MRYIKLFEYFQKTRQTSDITLAWSTRRLNPLDIGVWKGKGIEPNRKVYKKGTMDGIPYSSRTMFTFPNDGTLLENIKYISGGITRKDVAELVDYGISLLPSKMELENYDVVLIPDSRSRLLVEMVDALLDIAPSYSSHKKEWKPNVISRAFSKRNCNEVEWDMDKLNRVNSQDTRNQVLRIIEKVRGRTEPFRLSDHLQYPPHRKFVARFMDISPIAQEDVRGKRVLIVDDFVTDGTTKRQMRDLVLPFGPREVTNLALFNIKGARDSDEA